MSYDIVNEKPLSIITTPAGTFRFTNQTANTAWTDSGLGSKGIEAFRVLIYATAASGATFTVEVADNSSGANPIQVTITTPAVSVVSAFELRGVVPVVGKPFFRIVRGGTSATYDALVEVA